MSTQEFIELAAGLMFDGDCRNCRKDGNEPNPDCDRHRPWEMPGDDAVETLHSLIRMAREIKTAGASPSLTEDERLGLMEAVDKGHDDRTQYLQDGNPWADFGNEWPDTAREQARRWRDCASALRKLFGDPCAMADACEALVVSLDASAAEYEAEVTG